MTDEEFISSIDCRFPYEDEAAALALVRQAAAMSPQACFMIACELAGPPRNANPSSGSRLLVLHALRTAFEHPLRTQVLDLAELRIRDGYRSLEDALQLMNEIARYPLQYCALNLVYSACEDACDALDQKYEQIVSQWAAT